MCFTKIYNCVELFKKKEAGGMNSNQIVKVMENLTSGAPDLVKGNNNMRRGLAKAAKNCKTPVNTPPPIKPDKFEKKGNLGNLGNNKVPEIDEKVRDWLRKFGKH